MSDDTWTSLGQYSGDRSAPHAGAPDLDPNRGEAIAIVIERYNVIMFVQYLGGDDAAVWRYRAD